MKILLPLLLILLLSSSIAFAQETPEVSDWKTEQRCITAPSQPPDGWTYDGVIFTFRRGDGIHARRADMATPYYVAFDSDSEFGVAGSFSPDGSWLAVPAGQAYYSASRDEFDFGIDEYRIYSTTPTRTIYHLPVHGFGSGQSALHATSSRWPDNQHILFFGYGTSREYLFDFATQTISPSKTTLTAPDSVDTQWGIFEPFLRPIQWTADGSYFAAKLTDKPQIGLFNQAGQLVYSIPLRDWPTQFNFAPDGAQLAFIEQTDKTIQIADFATHTIIDTCIETPYSVAFSPDGKQLAFGLKDAGYVYILDLEAWQAYRIDLAAADVVGWYPLS